jgi:hypothetical protein
MDLLALIKREIASTDRNSWTGEVAGETVTLYAKPFTPAHTKHLRAKGIPDFVSNPSPEGMVEIIVQFSEFESGERAFPKPGVATPVVMRWGMDKISEIFSDLFGMEFSEDDDDVEDRVGNS